MGVVVVGLAGLVSVTATARTADADRGDRADPCAVGLPELRARAVAHAGLAAPPPSPRRARLAGLLPDVTLRASRGTAWDDPWLGPRPADDTIARRDAVEVRLTWRLDRLAYDPAEPTVAAGERSAARARLELEDEVTARYFRWRRAELDAADLAGPREQLAADEAFAALDGLTGGWLAAHLGCR